MTFNDKMTSLANAIREKTGGTEQLTVDGMTDAVNGITVGSTEYIIEPGTYTFVAAPNLSPEGYSGTGVASNYLYGDMPLQNPTKLSFSYGIAIYNNSSPKQLMALTNNVSGTGTMGGTKIYDETNGWADAYSKKYKVWCRAAVSEDFYNWWVANTTK